MNPDAKEVFTAYFGLPMSLYAVLAVLLVIVMGITLLLVIIKALKERGRDKDDADVMTVIVRGLFMLLLITAVFMST